MGITVMQDLLFKKPKDVLTKPKTGDLINRGKYYRHPDSATISYPLVVEKPLGTIEKELNIAIVGGGAAGLAALYELCRLKNSENNLHITIYESDFEHFLNVPETYMVRTAGLRAGRVSAAISGDETAVGSIDHAVYEIGAMRFPEIAGLTWHYINALYGPNEEVGKFPNPGTVPTELVHGNHVDRYGSGVWSDDNSIAKKVVAVVREGLAGTEDGKTISLFPIGGIDPAKISKKLKSKDTCENELKQIHDSWKIFARDNDKYTLESAVRMVLEDRHGLLPDVPGLLSDAEKINYYVALFGTIGFGTGGFKSIFNMSFVEMTRLLLWNYDNEYMLPVEKNVDFLRQLYIKACESNKHVCKKMARVSDAVHLDGNDDGKTMVVYYEIDSDGKESTTAKKDYYDYVILATTPKMTSTIISKVGFSNNKACSVPLGDHGCRLEPKCFGGSVRPALILSKKDDEPNSKLFTAISNVHMVGSSKVFATVKKTDFDAWAPNFENQGKIRAIVADCGLGSSYIIPSTIMGPDDETRKAKSKEYYSFLISYAWEDDTKGLQHHFGKFPINIDRTERMMAGVIGRTLRCVRDPVKGYGPWWFGEALNNCKLEDPMSYDWNTNYTAGAFKLDNAGDNHNSEMLFRYHTHAVKPELDNRFFLANDSYSHLGGWVEGAFMSAVNAVCGLIVAANGGEVKSLSDAAQKVITSFECVVEEPEKPENDKDKGTEKNRKC